VTTFEGRRALVTGSSRGIGRAIAIELADRGADVAINYVSQPAAADQVVDRLRGKGRRAFAVRADVSRHDEVERLFGSVEREWGAVDIFVNNAVDVSAFGSIARARLESWRHTVDSHMTPLLVAARCAARTMERGGSIVSVSSLGGRLCLPDYAAVGVGKAALEALTRYLAMELAPSGIAVNTVCAGPTDTNALRAYRSYSGIKAACERRAPGGRLGSPADIAKVVAFLCSEDARWIVGQTIVADGGVSLLSGVDAAALSGTKAPQMEDCHG
jgi:NAD(P)-dependent dehydrogenase (short-subunit alcohol dehydrogenase family)